MFSYKKLVALAIGVLLVSSGLLAGCNKAMIDNEINLPTIGDQQTLNALINKHQAEIRIRYALSNFGGMKEGQMLEMAPSAPTGSADMALGGGSNDYSETNVQVQGVDEADVVKTDGEYIYYIKWDELTITKAYPTSEMKVVNRISLGETDFWPREMYVDKARNMLVLIGETYSHSFRPYDDGGIEGGARLMMPPYFSETFTKVQIYDITDKANLKMLKEVEVEGSYTSSRKIEGSLYSISNKWIYAYGGGDAPVPHYREDGEEDYRPIGFDRIYYFPGFAEANYLNIISLDLDSLATPANIETYLGSGSSIYASLDNLYIASARYNLEEVTTSIFKFALEKGKMSYRGQGEVPGNILNQFSMDENKGYFRIATTTGQSWATEGNVSKNHVYILDPSLKIVGSVNDIAPTERIYSMRFMGDKAYMVTFRETDPFFVLDLSVPTSPQVLGYLKIPGYSDYLHPFDDNHIIGFGKEVYEIKGGFFQGGMKVAVFDVSDVNNPIEKWKIEIGDRGTHSELLYNHRALLFDKERNLLAFPVDVYELPEQNKGANGEPLVTDWGAFKFQGAYVYSLDMVNGFVFRGGITHITKMEYDLSGYYWYNSENNVNRIIRIGDVLYTLSNNKIKASDINSLRLLGEVLID